jgi:hypothetical protein
MLSTRADGYLATGDLGRLEDGYLVVESLNSRHSLNTLNTRMVSVT